MGKDRSKTAWPEERTSSRWLVPLDGERPRADESSKDPEALLSEAESPAAEEVPQEPDFRWDDVGRFLHRIPAFEADIIRLRLQGISQQQIGRVFGVVQQTVSYRLRRAMQRIRWLSTMPELTEEGFERDLGPLLTEREVQVLRTLWATGGQSRTAETLLERRRSRRHHGVFGQGQVRIIAIRALKKLRDAKEGHDEVSPYLTFFEDMFSNRRWGLAAEMRNAAESRIRAAEVISMDDDPED